MLRPLDDLGPTSDIEDADYQEGLAELWKGQDGKRYGAPKDWDTIAMFYDNAALEAAGVDPASWRSSRGTRRTAAPSRSPSHT